ncbi:hypothetical protein [Candidatus Liberibacter brunswickensis]|uniref:hypothetical protein n=1 Tax=Candidatus Liberibacter brunswickensis TaxID=1968796 RepID=UPI002FE12FE3
MKLFKHPITLLLLTTATLSSCGDNSPEAQPITQKEQHKSVMDHLVDAAIDVKKAAQEELDELLPGTKNP